MRRVLVLVGVLAVALLVVLVWRPWGAAPGDVSGEGARTIVLVTIDTLRRDRVGAYGANRLTPTPLTPRLDALAAEGTLFADARTPVPLTLPAHAVMFTGLPPAAIGVRVNAHGRYAAPEHRDGELVAEALRRFGYRTAAFVSANPLIAAYGLEQGFDHYDDEGLDVPGGLAYAERPGKETVDRALAYVRAAGAADRLFLWVHLFEPHAPYAPHLSPAVPLDVRYDADVAEADRVVGLLLDGLADVGRGDAAVLVTADHGEALDELGERTHGLLLGDAVLRVPLLLRVPGRAPAVRDDPVDLADVAPTLAALAGRALSLEPWVGPGRGEDLLSGPQPDDRVRVAETLYPHQRYRWAQLTGAVGRTGMLVDAGGDRVVRLVPAALRVPQGAPRPVRDWPEVGALAQALRAYREGERGHLIRQGGTAAAGYGHAGTVEPFLPAEANGHLPDPYDAVPRAVALDRWAQALTDGAEPRDVLAALARMAARDPGNPEVHFARGRALEQVARTARTPAEEARARERAEEAYLRAWEAGRRDATTLGLAVGVNAERREGEALATLRLLQRELVSDCRLAILEARLLRAAGRDDEADEVCAKAAELCVRPWEVGALERARSDGTCAADEQR